MGPLSFTSFIIATSGTQNKTPKGKEPPASNKLMFTPERNITTTANRTPTLEIDQPASVPDDGNLIITFMWERVECFCFRF